MNQPSQQQLMGQPMGQASPAQVGQRTGPLLVNQPLPSTSQQPFGAPNSQPPPPPPPPQPQQQMAQQMMGLNQQPPQSPQIAPRINSPMNPPAPSSMVRKSDILLYLFECFDLKDFILDGLLSVS
jgi:hypothetical protein